MRIDKEHLLDLAVATPPDSHLLLEIGENGVVRRVPCASEWALAEYFQLFRPSNRVRGFVIILASGASLPHLHEVMDECLVNMILLVHREADGMPSAVVLYRRGDTSPRGKRYSFFLMPDEIIPVLSNGDSGALLLFNGVLEKPFIREMIKLSRDAGFSVTATLLHRSAHFLTGSLRALADRISTMEDSFETIIFASDPGDRVVASLADLTGKEVLTREDLIISIFEKRANGHAGKLTAASSAVGREKVRHRERSHGLSRLTGGVLGARGPGETVKEERKRVLKRRERRIREALEKEKERRERQRRFRLRTTYPTVAIVGYTNAGKSTLFNALIGETVVRAADEFFSSIDPKIRLVSLFGRKFFLLDTVGFIEGMSRGVLDAFEPTFDEIILSLIHI